MLSSARDTAAVLKLTAAVAVYVRPAQGPASRDFNINREASSLPEALLVVDSCRGRKGKPSLRV